MTRFENPPLETNCFLAIPCSRVSKNTYSYSCRGSFWKYTGSFWEVMLLMIEKLAVLEVSGSILEVTRKLFFTLKN